MYGAASSKLWREGVLDTKCIAEYGLSPSWSPSYLVRLICWLVINVSIHATDQHRVRLLAFVQGLLYQRCRLLNIQAADTSDHSEGGHSALSLIDSEQQVAALTHVRFRTISAVSSKRKDSSAGVTPALVPQGLNTGMPLSQSLVLHDLH